MLALIVVANPSPASFAHAIADRVRRTLADRGYEIAFHDLYAQGFDPVQPGGEGANTRSDNALVEAHCAQLARADLIAIVHPNWWGQPPAIMKGWIDRVFRLDTAYGYPPGVAFDGVPVGLLKARHALVFNTSNTPAAREAEAFGDPLEAIWKRCVFGLCGVDSVIRQMFGPVSGSSAAQREQWLAQVESAVAGVA
ncbi:MAG: NAD(P)H-dependent oxidoreductase [Lysobacter sp.]